MRTRNNSSSVQQSSCCPENVDVQPAGGAPRPPAPQPEKPSARPPGSPPTVRTCRVTLWSLQARQVLRLWSAWTKCPVHNVALQYVVSQQAAKLQRAVGSESTRWQWEMGRPPRAETRGGARARTEPRAVTPPSLRNDLLRLKHNHKWSAGIKSYYTSTSWTQKNKKNIKKTSTTWTQK